MAASALRLTPRDLDILAALDRSPLTAQQLYKLSGSFAVPFTHERRVRERMQVLHTARLVHRSAYATAGAGAPAYFRLARSGFELLHGPEIAPPTKRHFSPVGIGRQHHTHCLADFIVHTCVAAAGRGVSVDGFCRENSVRLTDGDASVYPDCAFQLVPPAGRPFGFFVELDNSTERIQSPRGYEGWDRKIRIYDRIQDRYEARFRVLIVITRSPQRLSHILTAAAQAQRNASRSLFYGISLAAYLGKADPLHASCFLDHRLSPVALLPA